MGGGASATNVVDICLDDHNREEDKDEYTNEKDANPVSPGRMCSSGRMQQSPTSVETLAGMAQLSIAIAMVRCGGLTRCYSL